jgi:amino acid adenylation domain-containing protein
MLPAVRTCSNGSRYRLTSLQSRMIRALQRAPRSGVYVVQDVCELPEPPDDSVLTQAWRLVAQRHPALRMAFEIRAGDELWQHVLEDPDVPWQQHDWSDIPAARRNAALEAFLQADRERGFEFLGEVPMRFTTIRCAEHPSYLIWTTHHVLRDGRSSVIVWREWLALYDALRRGQQLQLPDAPSFEDQLAWLEQQDEMASESYWRGLFAGFSHQTGPFVDQIRKASIPVETGFAREGTELPPDLTRTLQDFAASYGITLNTLLQGAWAVVLGRYSGTADVVFGVTRAGRYSSVEGAANMVGLLNNTLPFRVSIPADARVEAWLRLIRSEWVGMRDYEHTPLERVQEWAGFPVGTPPYSSLVIFEHATTAEFLHGLGGAWTRRTLNHRQTTDIPLTFAAYGGNRLRLELIYDTRQYCQQTIAAMLGHLVSLMGAFAAHRNGTLRQIQMLITWDAQTGAQPVGFDTPDVCAHRLFEQQVLRRPTQTALESDGARLSYDELNSRANRLAYLLRSRGARAEDLILLCMEAGAEAVIAVLAVLKSGAGFVLVDPHLPAARLAAIVAETVPKFVLTVAGQAPLEGAGCPVWRFDECEAAALTMPAEDLPDHANCANAAYAIYTSGSSAQPKAVLVTHRSLVNHTLAVTAIYHISEHDRRLQFATVGSDVFVAEIFNYLSSGATLVFHPAARKYSAAEFLRVLDTLAISITGVPSSWWNELVCVLETGETLPRTLRVMISGMERVDPGVFARWKLITGTRVRWFNAYGPTEAGPTATIYEAGSSVWENAACVPIGKTIANTYARVLDEGGMPVPPGVPGELYLGGASVARGYLNAPETSRQRFLADPLLSERNARLYRTGDRVFALPDGNLVFLGRVDRQIKVRGFRVELDQIEEALSKDPAVHHCAVILGGPGGAPQLRAFVTARNGGVLRTRTLRQRLSRELPAYMVPAAFTVLPELPLTRNGKTDFQALAEIQPGRSLDEKEIHELTGPTEFRLASMWQHILGIDRIGATDDFFELGGDSLRATRLMHAIQETFQIEMPFSVLLEAPTIALLARRIERNDTKLSQRDCGIPLFGIATRNFALRRMAPYFGDAQPFVHLYHDLREGNRLRTVSELAGMFCDSIRSVKPKGPYMLCGYCFNGVLAVETARQLKAEGEEIALVVLLSTPLPGYPRVLRSLRAAMVQCLKPSLGWYGRMVYLYAVGKVLARRARSLMHRFMTQTTLTGTLKSAASPSQDHARLAASYRPESIGVPIVHFVPGLQLRSQRALEDPRMAWEHICYAGFKVYSLPSWHGEMLAPQTMDKIAATLRDLIDSLSHKTPPVLEDAGYRRG